MPPSPAPTRKPLPVRITPELLDRIDALRDPLIPREAYVRHLLTKAIDAEEAKTLKSVKP